ncbi:dTMP kinase [Synechococcus sp. Tobar12-5m-g]|uniref:dTMP kinase n=1 Tax=unclassified Synechococcus TaxID=2626047 RepID=UPI0020CCF464|nr:MULTISPECIES: dTMP kinase [unclassified Synechococcus]MCP9772525.1 dTMP kinase [Synechococcus sp. Tobar12-5m-g]MCP9873364.1 dTMP kinase [Synechococcus sp. Cruz CV-v-12]
MAAPEDRPGRGRFLVLEGIDGCGKTTQLELLRRWLPSSGLMPEAAELVVSREPGGTPLGLALRQLLLHPPEASIPCPTAELLLYAADRAQHVQELIAPALEAGDWVVSDRFTGSTAAYQGHGRGLSLELIATLETIATAGLSADLTLWLDLPLELSLQRRGHRHRPADRIEAGGIALLERVRQGFAALAPARGWQRIDAAPPTAEVAAAIRAAVAGRVGIQADG